MASHRPGAMPVPVIILKEGTEDSQGTGQIVSNINACEVVVDVLRTTLGPRGMDKLIRGSDGRVTISNDGATILRLLNVVHPAARLLVEVARSQDEEVGDGTTTVVLLAGELLRQAKAFIEDGVHPHTLIRTYRAAGRLAAQRIQQVQVDVAALRTVGDTEAAAAEYQRTLERCASTALNSKLIARHKHFFAGMAVEAVRTLDAELDLSMVGIKKVGGGSITDSFLVPGVGFKKTFSYAGFEQQPKKILDPRVMLLNIELELKSEKENAEVRIASTDEYQRVVDAEWNIIYEKLDAIAASGAQVVLSRLAIGDLATQYFADRHIFCAGRVPDADMQRVAKAVGAAVQTTLTQLQADKALGTCACFEERQVGAERFNFFTGCPHARSATVVLRGGSEQFLEEAERSLHDALMIVRRTIKFPALVAGGGAIEMELSRYLREHSRRLHGAGQLIMAAYARALETIPRALCENAGLDATDVLNRLRAQHATDERALWCGVDLETGDIGDCWAAHVWEPALVRRNALAAATEAACVILSVDETLKAETNENDGGGGGGMAGAGGMPRTTGRRRPGRGGV